MLDSIEYSIDHPRTSFKAAVKPGKACCIDGITVKDLKTNEEISINSLRKVVQKSKNSGSFPCQGNCSTQKRI